MEKIKIEKWKGRFWVFKAEPLNVGSIAEHLGRELKVLGYTKDDVHFENINREDMEEILKGLI